MRNVGRIVGIVAAVACVGSLALAEGAGKQAERPAKDKAATCKAAKHKAPGGRFKALDADANGSISLAEFSAMHEKRIAARKKKMGDKWSEERAAKMPTAEVIFKKHDTDGDGALSAKEMGHGKRKSPRKGKKDGDRKARKAKADKAE